MSLGGDLVAYLKSIPGETIAAVLIVGATWLGVGLILWDSMTSTAETTEEAPPGETTKVKKRTKVKKYKE